MDLKDIPYDERFHNDGKICGFCGKKLNPIGYDYLYFNISPEFIEYERCTCEKSKQFWEQKDFEKERAEKRESYRKCINKLYKENYIGNGFQGYNFQNFEEYYNNDEILIGKDYAEKCIQNCQENGLIITGESDSGKTHLAAAIANKLIENGQIVIMSRLNSMLDVIKDTFKTSNKSEKEYIELFSNIEMLVIDDLGTEKISNWALEKLYAIITNRNEKRLPFIITTSFNKDNLLERFDQFCHSELAKAMIAKLYRTCYGIELKKAKEKASTSDQTKC